MTGQQQGVRSRLSLEDRWDLIMANLERYFDNVKNDLIQRSFHADICGPIAMWDNPAVDDLVEIIRQFVSMDERDLPAEQLTGNPLSALIISATYCYRASQAIQGGDRELGWIYLAEASFWCGVTLSGKGIDEAYQRTLKESLSQNAKKGGDKLAENVQPIIEYAQQLARDAKPSSGWRSRNHAVQTIYKRVNAFAEEHGRTYSEAQAEDTMGKWLSQMLDEELFPTAQRKKKDKNKHRR
jgi:hypothetical protein